MYLLKSKDETIDIFKYYKNEIENQLDKKIKTIRSDKGESTIYLLMSFIKSMVLFIKLQLLIHLNLMELLSAKIVH